MKKKLFCVGLATAVALCSAVSVSASDFVDSSSNNESCTMVLWGETFDSMDDIMANSDVIITGTVESQSVVKLHNLYFTHSYVRSAEGVMYDVTQTGAYVNGEPENIPIDSELLKLNESYFLCLDESLYNGEPYYLIVGGNQGYGVFDEANETVYAVNIDSRAVFSTMQIENTQNGISAYNIEPVAVSMYKDQVGFKPQYYFWDKTNISFHLDNRVDEAPAQGYRVVEGANQWNGISSYHLTETSSSNADIEVVYADYTSSWVGMTEADASLYTYADGQNIYTFDNVEISLNFDYRLSSSADEYAFWLGISCHEFGHALGLPHFDNTNNGVNIMHSDISDYLERNGSPYKPRTSGSASDKEHLDDKYTRWEDQYFDFIDEYGDR